MISFSIYNNQDKNLIVKYYPEERTLYIQPKGIDEQKIELFKNSLETSLSIESSVEDRDPKTNAFLGWSIKVKPESAPQVEELLKAKGLESRKSVSDSDGGQQEEPPQQPPMPQESIVSFMGKLLSESTYRTAKYWEELLHVAGKPNKQDMREQDILGIRKIYTRKPQSEYRNKILRSLDNARAYFYRKLKKEKGKEAAIMFKKEYNAIGNLVPSDYAEREPGVDKNSEENYSSVEQQKLNLMDIFPKEDSLGPEDIENI